MQVVDAHKGPVRWQVDVKGRAAHSSMAPLGVNAVTYAARLAGAFERIEPNSSRPARRCRFDPPYATLQVTQIDGGTATNIVPAQCSFVFDIRALPGLDPDEIENRLRRASPKNACLPEMRAIAPEADIHIERVNAVPPFGAERTSEVVALALKLDRTERDVRRLLWTEAGLFQEAGAPAVVCGPGDIAQAHTADEWIAERRDQEVHGLPRPARRMGRARRAHPLASSARSGISAFGTNVANATFSPKEKRPTKTW